MRVLLVSQEFPPETGWGGIGTYLRIIAPALARAGAEVHVLSVVEGQPRSEREVEGAWVHRAPLRRPRGIGRAVRLRRTWSRLCGAASVALEVRRMGMRFDVCECPDWRAEGLFLALRGRLPLVVRLHSRGSQIFPHLGEVGLDRRLIIRLEHEVIRRAAVVTGTRAQTSTVARELDLEPDRVRTITYPVDLPGPTAPPDGSPRVLFAGRFEPRKGPETLLRAMPRLIDRVPDARAVLLGAPAVTAGDTYTRLLRALASELGVEDSVEIVERWGRDAVEQELSRAAVCAVPSAWESFGYVAAEAAAAGRPVVASRIPALEDVVVDGVTGRLVPPGDADSLADALAEVLASPETTRRMGAAAAREISERSDPDRVARQTLSAYERAIEIARLRR